MTAAQTSRHSRTETVPRARIAIVPMLPPITQISQKDRFPFR
jgi:hypothetical protein